MGPASLESGPNEPAKVPSVAAEQLAVLLSGGPAPLRVPGAAGRGGFPPPAAGLTPSREIRTRERRREQEQEGAPEPHGVHGAAADGPGETLREAEISVHS